MSTATARQLPTVVLLVVGDKGANLLADFPLGKCQLVQVVTYEQQPNDPAVDRIQRTAAAAGVPVLVQRRVSQSDLPSADLVFLAGWQFIVDLDPRRTVILHDSLLPRYRGFAPTVAALINGDDRIGVTALRPAPAADEGDILATAEVPIAYPMRIAEAFEALRPAYGRVSSDVMDSWTRGTLEGFAQDPRIATYSLWRDDADYVIDWSWAASRIVRFVHAVGAPYSGARTLVGDTTVIVVDAEEVDDLSFVQRQAGKIWRLSPAGPEVVCGSGMIRLTSVVGIDGGPFTFSRVRVRLG
jgi:methionyl-tRNA formyltransferase